MKNLLTIAAVALGCCLTASAQMGSSPTGGAPSQTQPSTPPTFPSDQTGSSNTSSNPGAMPPDTKAQTHDSVGQASNVPPTSITGCLSQSSDGKFMLADNSGNNYQLQGHSSELNTYLGRQVRVTGTPAGSSSSSGAMAAPSGASSSASGATQFAVSHVHKVSDDCSTAGTAAPR